ncbi:MAG: hypothetical protein ICV66_09655, partial [Chitinophagaceae bacterium]|nr:hypothetical protein [Chitinophagaceae bacterium]
MKCFYSTLTIIFFIIQVGLTSCTKDKEDTTVTLKILTANAWKYQEIRGVLGNTIIYYLRGGSSNLQNFDNEYILFREDKTGLY